MERTLEEFIKFFKNECNGHIGLWTGILDIHTIGEFFGLENNSGAYLRSLFQRISYRVEKFMKQESRIKKKFYMGINPFRQTDREVRQKVYMWEE